MVAVGDVVGLLRRSRISFPDGRHDTTTQVAWLQGPSLYVDLRVPEDGAAAAGFAGRCTSAGGLFTWQRLVDLQPPGEHPDQGRVRWDGDVLIEDGVHEEYQELWHPEPAVTGPAAAALLDEAGTGCVAVLVRVGDVFGFAEAGEVCLGRVTGGTWSRERSSEPALVGAGLALRRSGQELVTGDRRWRIAEGEGNAALLA